MKNDRAALEEHMTILLEDRYLPERLQCAVVRLVLVALLQEARRVGKARFPKRPARAKIAHLPLCERGNPTKSRYRDHAVSSSWSPLPGTGTGAWRAPAPALLVSGDGARAPSPDLETTPRP